MKTFNLKQSFMLLIAIVVLAFISIGAVSYTMFTRIQHLDELSGMVDRLQIEILDARKNEKDFLARETINKSFFETNESKYLSAFKKNIDTLNTLLLAIRASDFVAQSDVDTILKNCQKPLSDYNQSFQTIKDKVVERGFKDFGVEGTMRKAIHEVEAVVENRKNDKQMIHTLLLRRHEKDFLLRKDTAYIAKFNTEWTKFAAEVKHDAELSKCLQTYKTSFQTMIEINQTIGLNEKTGLMGNLRQSIHQTEPRIKAAHAGLTQEIKAETQSTIVWLSIIILLCSCVAVFLMVYIIKQVFRQVGGEPAEVARIANEIANGNLAIELKESHHYTGIMQAMAVMAERLDEVMEAIIDNTAQITESSQQLSQTAEQLSTGATEQASAVEEISATMEEITSIIEHNAENAQQTESTANSAGQSISEVSKKAEQAIQASMDIAEKTSMINYIAEKTSILAINASIEAARAGDAGKGFAVVAQEVQKLADNSIQTAKEVAVLAKRSNQLSLDTGTLMNDTLPRIENTIVMVKEISLASAEQNAGVAQVNGAIQQFNNVVQQNAASSEEMAASAEMLSSQAQRLQEVTEYFKTKQTLQYRRKETKSVIKPAAKPKRIKLDLHSDFEKY